MKTKKQNFKMWNNNEKIKITQDDVREILIQCCTLNKEEREQLLSSVLVGGRKLIDLIPPDFFKEVDENEWWKTIFEK